jgi:hypothetical protein
MKIGALKNDVSEVTLRLGLGRVMDAIVYLPDS